MPDQRSSSLLPWIVLLNAVLALFIVARARQLRAEWLAWNTVVEAESVISTRADTTMDPLSRPPPVGPGR